MPIVVNGSLSNPRYSIYYPRYRRTLPLNCGVNVFRQSLEICAVHVCYKLVDKYVDQYIQPRE